MQKRKRRIDFDASPVLAGADMGDLAEKLLDYVISVANGEQTKNEQFGYIEISIFKDGVTL